MASRAAENDLTLFDHDLNDTVEYEDLSMETSNSANKRMSFSTATIEYSSLSVCVCVSVCLSFCVHNTLKK